MRRNSFEEILHINIPAFRRCSNSIPNKSDKSFNNRHSQIIFNTHHNFLHKKHINHHYAINLKKEWIEIGGIFDICRARNLWYNISIDNCHVFSIGLRHVSLLGGSRHTGLPPSGNVSIQPPPAPARHRCALAVLPLRETPPFYKYFFPSYS